jgi:hypothetical protein
VVVVKAEVVDQDTGQQLAGDDKGFEYWYWYILKNVMFKRCICKEHYLKGKN